MDGTDAMGAEISAYKFTVEAIVCIGRAFKDLAGARLRQGPRMRTAGGTVVTPDMTLEARGRPGDAGYRAVVEVKSSFPHHAAAIEQMAKQVHRYDSELGGWEYEAPHDGSGGQRDDHDIVVVVRASHAHGFAAGLPAALRERGIKIKSPLSIIGMTSNKNNGDEEEYILKRSSGAISHKKAHETLGRGWSIDGQALLNDLRSTKFYDSKPPLPYIMAVLWIYVFLNLMHGKKLKRFRGNAEVCIVAEVDRIHRLASELAHSSNPGCVKRAWIKDAMEEFVRIGLAERTGEDMYTIHYSSLESRPTEWLAGAVAAAAAEVGGSDDSE